MGESAKSTHPRASADIPQDSVGGTDFSRIHVQVLRTDEEAVIARHMASLL